MTVDREMIDEALGMRAVLLPRSADYVGIDCSADDATQQAATGTEATENLKILL